MAALLLAGAPPRHSPASTALPAAGPPAPGKGGKIVWASTLPSTWDPITSTAGTDVTALSLVYSGLTKMDVKGHPVPDLASGWTWSKNGLSLTFTLRPGLVFSDGTKLDAKAVKQNILRGRDDQKSLIAPQLAPIASVATPNATTVRSRSRRRTTTCCACSPARRASSCQPEGVHDATPAGLSTQPVGAGPFKLTNLVSGSSATLVRNPTYWDARNVLLSELDLRLVPNPQTVVASLKTGDINMAWIGTNTVIPALQGPGRASRSTSCRACAATASRSTRRWPRSRTSRSCRPSTTRSTARRSSRRSSAASARSATRPSRAATSATARTPRTSTRTTRRRRRRCWPRPATRTSGPAFPITYFDYGPYKALAQLLQSELNAVGFQTTLTVLPLAQAAQAVYVDHSVAFNPNGISGRESPLQMLQVQYAKDGLLNPCRCAPSKLTAAFDAVAKMPTDSKKYPALLQKATAIAAKTSANIFLATQPWVYARSTKVQGLQPYLVSAALRGRVCRSSRNGTSPTLPGGRLTAPPGVARGGSRARPQPLLRAA